MEDSRFTVGIVGTGNVAWHLISALRQKAVIKFVAGRDPMKASELAALGGSQTFTLSELNTLSLSNPDSSDIKVDFCIIAVNDSAIAEVANQLRLCGIVVHTSGSVSILALSNCKASGVLYPLMSLSKGIDTDWRNLPIFVEGNSAEVEQKITALARLISTRVSPLTSYQRQHLHMAAVFACNFPYFLLGKAQRIMSEAGLPFDLLKPLVEGTVDKAFNSAEIHRNLTGPAARNDLDIINLHLSRLNEEDRSLYDFITRQIMNLNNRE